MALDDTVYKDPHTFNPARYLPQPEGDNEPYPTASFGFGRRVCPGQHLANSTLWISIASILASLNISKAIGENGEEITPEVATVCGLTK
ncbi:hypothetical protein H0H81_009095 [Sphagnurus paluster]|uniref:Cytochrome P450 n=1 Tax=Sphagnurus paluster TaxID=117069 RepID=A0A9P7GQL0_9AGAR|nr:hypothetical protein H0H81_009095 [Sphagnurus paluster]